MREDEDGQVCCKIKKFPWMKQISMRSHEKMKQIRMWNLEKMKRSEWAASKR